jgi:hypothetical protein
VARGSSDDHLLVRNDISSRGKLSAVLFDQSTPHPESEQNVVWEFIWQLLAAGSLPAVLTCLEAFALSVQGSSPSPLGSVWVQLATPLTFALVSYKAGASIASFRRLRGQRVAARVWLLPTVVLAVAIGSDLWTFHFDWGLVWREYFFWSHPGGDEGPLLRDLLTYPAISSAAYSFGAYRAGLRIAAK